MMTCPEMKNNLAEAVFESRPLVEEARKHLAECGECTAEMGEMETTWKLLDEWQAPEPSAFFDAKLYARLRTEQSQPSANLFERAKAWLLYSSNLHMRQITVGALATVLAVCGGTFALLEQPQAAVPQASATVGDLQSFDGNAQMFQQLNALDGDEDNATGASN